MGVGELDMKTNKARFQGTFKGKSFFKGNLLKLQRWYIWSAYIQISTNTTAYCMGQNISPFDSTDKLSSRLTGHKSLRYFITDAFFYCFKAHKLYLNFQHQIPTQANLYTGVNYLRWVYITSHLPCNISLFLLAL